ncbi:MAG: membrane protein insertion efficiency factor YidD [Bacteroidales bacterium]|nr:membrane protein insertion efficiency factor YidD [Candidatus Physcocola equi]
MNKIKKYLRKTFLLPVYFYRYCISPFTPPVCRFTPSCSQYAVEAVLKHGIIKGTWLAIKRICRCRPGGGSGYDPVP